MSFRSWKVFLTLATVVAMVWTFLVVKEAVPHPATYLSLLTNGGLLNSGTQFNPVLAVDWTLAPAAPLTAKDCLLYTSPSPRD